MNERTNNKPNVQQINHKGSGSKPQKFDEVLTVPGGLWYWSSVALKGDSSGLAVRLSRPAASGEPSRRIKSSSSTGFTLLFFNRHAKITKPPTKRAPPTPKTAPMIVFLVVGLRPSLPLFCPWFWPPDDAGTVGVSTVVLVDRMVET